MTIESFPPQAELGPALDNGQAAQQPSQGHRRRRRRRKNKGSQQAPQQAPQMQQPQQQPQSASPAPPRPPQQQPQQHGRKKKKFFQKSSAPQPQPGNSINPPSQGKRKSRQKGPREFVGPMDHSYRAVNGNVADGPPSTIPVSGNGHASHYVDAYHPQQPVPVREDAPTRIFCFIDDLFFQAKIQETSRKLGIKVEFIKGDKDNFTRLTDVPEAEWPTLIVFDLNNLNAKPMTLIPKFKSKFKKATSIVGFLSHLQGDLKMKALEAGCDTVMPRSAFSQSLPNLLRRYGMTDEEEEFAQPQF